MKKNNFKIVDLKPTKDKYRLAPKREMWIVQRISDRKQMGRPLSKTDAKAYFFKLLSEVPAKISESTIKRTVLIKDFIINEIIGIHKHEKINKQKIIFNIVIDVNQNTIPNENNLSSIEQNFFTIYSINKTSSLGFSNKRLRGAKSKHSSCKL